MLKKLKFVLIAASLLLFTQAYAGGIKITDAWTRATAPGQENGSVGVIITSPRDARLIAVSTKVADSAEIHTMSMDNGVMKMRQLEFLPLPANAPVTLGPGGDHLMLFGLKHALKAGQKVPLILTIQYADKSVEKINIKAEVRSLTGGAH
jgi:periplasmic copper chaperone A